jgi:hypothetical protein
MKPISSKYLLSFSLLLLITTTGHAFTELARGALTLTTTGQISYDSNILSRNQDVGDTIYTLTPILKYKRAAGLGSIDADLGTSVYRYDTESNFNGEDLFANVRIGLPTPQGARDSGSVGAGYSNRASIDQELSARVRTKEWHADAKESFRIGSRTLIRGDASFSNSTRSSYSDMTQWSVGTGLDYGEFLGGFGVKADYKLTSTDSTDIRGDDPLHTVSPNTGLDQMSNSISSGIFYKFSSALRASADIGYRWINRSAAETASGKRKDGSMTYSLRIDGPFLPPKQFPKLKSSLSLGFEKGEALGLNDKGSTTLTGNLSLSWQARERTSLQVGANRKQSIGIDNYSSVNSGLDIGAVQQIGEQVSVSAKISQEWIDYVGKNRSDNRTSFNTRVSYFFNKRLEAGVSYLYTISNSNEVLHDYHRRLYTLSATYTF